MTATSPLLAALRLPPPTHLAEAVPANRACGQPTPAGRLITDEPP